MFDPIWAWVVAGVVLVAWFLWISRGTTSADTNSISYRFHRAWRRIAFWAGDVRFYWQWYFGIFPLPMFDWSHRDYDITHEELLETCKLLEPGDVILATKRGYPFSNGTIPGLFKHAAIVTVGPDYHHIIQTTRMDEKGVMPMKDDLIADVCTVRIVEAVSEGVVKRHLAWARADEMIVLRPKHMEDHERARAAATADKLVGCVYDASFNFNIEEELEYLSKNNRNLADSKFQDQAQELRRLEANHKSEYDLAFSCTETVAAAWWFRRFELGIFRKKSRGRMCIIADQFVNRDMHIIWTNLTAERAKKLGLHEEGVREIAEYEKTKK